MHHTVLCRRQSSRPERYTMSVELSDIGLLPKFCQSCLPGEIRTPRMRRQNLQPETGARGLKRDFVLGSSSEFVARL